MVLASAAFKVVVASAAVDNIVAAAAHKDVIVCAAIIGDVRAVNPSAHKHMGIVVSVHVMPLLNVIHVVNDIGGVSA